MSNSFNNIKVNLYYLLPLILIGTAVFFLCLWNVLTYESLEWPLTTLTFLEHPTWQGFWDIVRLHNIYQWHYDNIRFMQTVGFLIYFFPPYVADFAAGVSVVCMLKEMAALAGAWRQNMFTFALCTAGGVFLLPWYNVQINSVWILNYTLPAALWAYTLRRWLSAEHPLSPLAAFALGFMISWMHELYAAILFAGVCIVALAFRRYRTKTGLMLILGGCIPLAVALNIPGTAYRISIIDPSLSILWLVHDYMIVPIVICTILALTVPRIRKKCNNPVFWAIAAGAFGGAAVYVKYGYSPRTTWGQAECGILLMILVLSCLKQPSTIMKRVVVSVIWISVAAHYALAVSIAYSYHRIELLANKAYDPVTRVQPAIYADYPVLTRADLVGSLIKYHPDCMIDYLYLRNVLPAEIADFNPDSCRTVKSNLNDAVIYDCKGILVTDRNTEINSLLHTCFSNGSTIQTELISFMFESPHGSFNMLSPRRRTRYIMRINGAPIDSICFNLSQPEVMENHWEKIMGPLKKR